MPVFQLSASNSNGSQGLNRGSSLNNSLATQHAPLHCTNWTEIGRSSYIASERTIQKTPLPTVLPLLRADRCLATAAFSLFFRGRCLVTGLYATITMYSHSDFGTLQHRTSWLTLSTLGSYSGGPGFRSRKRNVWGLSVPAENSGIVPKIKPWLFSSIFCSVHYSIII
jgi:hypothetical protein